MSSSKSKCSSHSHCGSVVFDALYSVRLPHPPFSRPVFTQSQHPGRRPWQAFQHPPASATPTVNLSYLRTILSELQHAPVRISAAAHYAPILPKRQRWYHLKEGKGSWGTLRLRKVQGVGRMKLNESN